MKRRRHKRATKPPIPGRLIGYARVSTEDQRLDLQIAALKKRGCRIIFTEKLSGAARKRPALERAIEALLPGDALVLYRFDRLSRMVLDQHQRLGEIERRGAKLVSLTESFDIATAAGRFTLGTMGLIAQFERDLISERTRAGMREAMAQGRRMGPPFKVKRKIARAIRALRRPDGTWRMAGGVRAVAAKFRLSQGSIHNCLSRPLLEFPA